MGLQNLVANINKHISIFDDLNDFHNCESCSYKICTFMPQQHVKHAFIKTSIDDSHTTQSNEWHGIIVFKTMAATISHI